MFLGEPPLRVAAGMMGEKMCFYGVPAARG